MHDQLAWFDHALAVAFAVGFPAVATPLYAARRPRLLANDSGARKREYWETVAWLAGMGLLTLAVWIVQARPFDSLGLAVSTSPWTWLALGLALAASVLIALQARGIVRDATARDAAREALAPVREYLPATEGEARLFRGVAFSAGIGEEIFYRGFLLWYLSRLMPLLAAVVVSSLLFGLAHIMHGRQAAIRAALMGLVLAGLYLLGGTLLAPMLLHTAIDLSNGAIGRAAFAPEAEAPASEAPQPD